MWIEKQRQAQGFNEGLNRLRRKIICFCEGSDGKMNKNIEVKKAKVKDSYTCKFNFTLWLDAQVPRSRANLDKSPNRARYVEMLLAGITYKELVLMAKKNFGESFSVRGFCSLNSRIPKEIKNPIERVGKFIKETPYRVNEILWMEELVIEQRKRFMQFKELEEKASAPFNSRSQVARDLHSLLVDLLETKMKAGIITRSPRTIELSGIKSVSQYSEEEKDKELGRITAKLRYFKKRVPALV